MKAKIVYRRLLLLTAALVCVAQAQNPGSAKPAAASTPSSAPGEKKKPKKVWTNDELGSVSGGVSVVGDANPTGNQPSPRNPESSAGNDFRQKQIENYRNQIQQLQSQIEAADKRIAQLKNFKGENTSPAGGINPTQGYNMVPVEEQVRQLEEKKKQLQAKIDDVQVDARKNGIDPGALR
jgi:TolA-binding protein